MNYKWLYSGTLVLEQLPTQNISALECCVHLLSPHTNTCPWCVGTPLDFSTFSDIFYIMWHLKESVKVSDNSQAKGKIKATIEMKKELLDNYENGAYVSALATEFGMPK